MLRTRLLTAVVLIPIVSWLMIVGGLPFFALMALLATIAEIEFSSLLSDDGFRPIHLFGIGMVWVCLLDGQYPKWHLLDRGLVALVLLSLFWQVLRGRRWGIGVWAGAIASGLYVGLCASSLVRLRAMPEGLYWTYIVVPVALFADSTAYLIGTKWGRRKLAPRLSCKKTWEGYVGGVALGTLLAATLGALWTLPTGPGSPVTWTRGLVLGLLVSSIAPVGDLAISMVKREAGVKDTGGLLPGHGGVLDRMDSILFAVVIGYIYVSWLVD